MLAIKPSLQHASKYISLMDAQTLLSGLMRVDKTYLISHAEDRLSWAVFLRFIYSVVKRKHHWPIAYILHKKEFFGHSLSVNKHTLIPRPETEIVVEYIHNTFSKQDTYLDIGTGSGAIAIAIKKQHPNNAVIATDISKKALAVAKKNAKQLGADISFYQSNLLQNTKLTKHLHKTSSLVIIANLPYLTEQEFIQEPTIQKEPGGALVAQDNGLTLYKTLLKQLTKSQIHNWTLYMEINPHQTASLSKYIRSMMVEPDITVISDLCGKQRFIRVSHTK